MQKKIIHTTTILLLLILSAIQLVGLLHTHPEFSPAKQTVLFKGGKCGTEVGKLTLKCKICSLAFHKHQYELPISPVFSFQLKPINIKNYQAPKGNQLFDTAVNCWTNKGPPILA